MSGAANIQYITHQQIDKNKWDDCIATADNGLDLWLFILS